VLPPFPPVATPSGCFLLCSFIIGYPTFEQHPHFSLSDSRLPARTLSPPPPFRERLLHARLYSHLYRVSLKFTLHIPRLRDDQHSALLSRRLPPHHPPRHLRTWVPPPTALLHLTRCRIHLQLSLIRSVPSADYLARTFRHRDFHHLSPLSPLGQTGSTVYFPLEFFSLSGRLSTLVKCYLLLVLYVETEVYFIYFYYLLLFPLGRPPVCSQALVCGW